VSAFRFVTIEEAILLQAQSVERFGGSPGIRDEGALESALNAAKQRAFYEEASLAVCAATYAYHLTNAHAFVDGNKRVGLGVALGFLFVNGASINATNAEVRDLILGIADKSITRAQTEEFFTARIIPPA
jgi:death-on-curing protein